MRWSDGSLCRGPTVLVGGPGPRRISPSPARQARSSRATDDLTLIDTFAVLQFVDSEPCSSGNVRGTTRHLLAGDPVALLQANPQYNTEYRPPTRTTKVDRYGSACCIRDPPAGPWLVRIPRGGAHRPPQPVLLEVDLRATSCRASTRWRSRSSVARTDPAERHRRQVDFKSASWRRRHAAPHQTRSRAATRCILEAGDCPLPPSTSFTAEQIDPGTELFWNRISAWRSRHRSRADQRRGLPGLSKPVQMTMFDDFEFLSERGQQLPATAEPDPRARPGPGHVPPRRDRRGGRGRRRLPQRPDGTKLESSSTWAWMARPG